MTKINELTDLVIETVRSTYNEMYPEEAESAREGAKNKKSKRKSNAIKSWI